MCDTPAIDCESERDSARALNKAKDSLQPDSLLRLASALPSAGSQTELPWRLGLVVSPQPRLFPASVRFSLGIPRAVLRFLFLLIFFVVPREPTTHHLQIDIDAEDEHLSDESTVAVAFVRHDSSPAVER